MEKPESFFNEDVLRILKGPNSFIFTVSVRPKWDKIVDTFFKKVEGWSGLPEKLLYLYQHQFHQDMVSGLSHGRSDLTYIHLNSNQDIDLQIRKISGFISGYDFEKSEKSFVSDRVGFNCKTSRTEFEPESPNYWCNDMFSSFDSMSTFFRVTLGGEHELGALDIGEIFRSLKEMDTVLVGASLVRPLAQKALADENTLVYNAVDNPEHGYHIFENDYLSISIQQQSFRGVFTRIEDYDEHQDDLLDVKYYGKKEIPENVKKLQARLAKIYFERSQQPNAFFNDPRTEEGKKSIKLALESWPHKYKQQMKNLNALIQDIKRCGLENRAIAEYFFLEWFLLELYDEINIYTISHKNEDRIGNFRIKSVAPFTDTSGTGKQVSVGNDTSQFLIKKYDPEKLSKRFGYAKQKIAISKTNGAEILSFSTFVKGGDVRGKKYFAPLKHLGEIISCADGDWLYFLFQSKFDLEAQIAVREMEASLKGDHLFSRLDKASENKPDPE